MYSNFDRKALAGDLLLGGPLIEPPLDIATRAPMPKTVLGDGVEQRPLPAIAARKSDSAGSGCPPPPPCCDKPRPGRFQLTSPLHG